MRSARALLYPRLRSCSMTRASPNRCAKLWKTASGETPSKTTMKNFQRKARRNRAHKEVKVGTGGDPRTVMAAVRDALGQEAANHGMAMLVSAWSRRRHGETATLGYQAQGDLYVIATKESDGREGLRRAFAFLQPASASVA